MVRCSSAECIGAGLYHIECVWTPVWPAAHLQSASVLACTTSNVCGLPCGPLLLCRVHRCWLVPHQMCVDSRVARCSSAESIGAGLYHIECVWTPVWSAAHLQSASVLACTTSNVCGLPSGPLLICRVHRCWLVPHRMCVDSRVARCSFAECIGAGLYHIECVWTPVWPAAHLQSASVLACTTLNVCGLPCGPLLLCRVHRCWLVPHRMCVDSRVARCSSAECIGAGLYHIECVWTPVWPAAHLQGASVLACTTSNVCGLPCGPLLICRVHRCWLVPHRMCVDSRVARCSSAECIGAGLYHIECVWTPVWSAAHLQSASVLACTTLNVCGLPCGPLLLCRVHRCWLVPHRMCVDSRVVRCSSAECIGAGLYHIECVWTPVWSAAHLQSASVLACTTSNVCGLPCGPLLICRVHRCWLVPHRMCVDSRVVRCSSAECIGAGLYHIECVWTPVWPAAHLQSASVLACTTSNVCGLTLFQVHRYQNATELTLTYTGCLCDFFYCCSVSPFIQ